MQRALCCVNCSSHAPELPGHRSLGGAVATLLRPARAFAPSAPSVRPAARLWGLRAAFPVAVGWCFIHTRFYFYLKLFFHAGGMRRSLSVHMNPDGLAERSLKRNCRLGGWAATQPMGSLPPLCFWGDADWLVLRIQIQDLCSHGK